MVINTQVSTRKKERWIRSHIYRVYYFRLFFEKEQKASNLGERKKMAQRKEHLHKKVEEHMKYGETLQFNENEMKSLTFAIVQMVRKGKTPKEIIKEFEERGQI
jgi:hypothetical protein